MKKEVHTKTTIGADGREETSIREDSQVSGGSEDGREETSIREDSQVKGRWSRGD